MTPVVSELLVAYADWWLPLADFVGLDTLNEVLILFSQWIVEGSNIRGRQKQKLKDDMTIHWWKTAVVDEVGKQILQRSSHLLMKKISMLNPRRSHSSSGSLDGLLIIGTTHGTSTNGDNIIDMDDGEYNTTENYSWKGHLDDGEGWKKKKQESQMASVVQYIQVLPDDWREQSVACARKKALQTYTKTTKKNHDVGPLLTHMSRVKESTPARIVGLRKGALDWP
ncbi:hypothetical protein Tco_1080479 [Tanacetum coccineum]|uniref:Uncharacterized protein n=1 Tax=Tanacetum coccineum TaxID=301880 RepID=A0ABQ5HW33_9ASTR